MAKPKNGMSYEFSRAGFSATRFDDFLPAGRSLCLIASEKWPLDPEIQQGFVFAPFPLVLPLTAAAGLVFVRQFTVCRWLDMLDGLSQRVINHSGTRRQTRAAGAMIRLLQLIDWRTQRGLEISFELVQAAAHLLEIHSAAKRRKRKGRNSVRGLNADAPRNANAKFKASVGEAK